jgi:N-lysine methyltransferase SETD6
LDTYHIIGSRILSRSFNVEKWDSGEDEEENAAANTSGGIEMDVDGPQRSEGDESSSHHDEAEEDAGVDIDDSSDIAMVPMADMLNARYGSENVRSRGISLWHILTHPPFQRQNCFMKSMR